MGREEYLDAVEAELRRLTRGEQEDVRRELAAHMEDHVETLLAIGCTEEEADERATAAMGDPAETGRAIAKLYRPVWLWVERAAALLIAVTILWAMFGWPALGSAWSCIPARFCAPDDKKAVRIHERMTVGDDVVRFYGMTGYRPGEDCEVELWSAAYDRVPFGCVYRNIWTWMEVRAQNGEVRELYARAGGRGGDQAAYCNPVVPLKAGETSFTLRYERFGTVVEHTFELPEVEG